MDIKRSEQGLFSIETSSKSIKTPFFIPAISSVKTNEDLEEYYNVIKESSYPAFLISAYDLAHNKKSKHLINSLNETTKSTKIMTIMDSGGYEVIFFKDSGWSEENFEDILKTVDVDVCFSFDMHWKDDSNILQHAKLIAQSTAKTASLQSYGTSAPIVHGKPNDLANIIEEVLKKVTPEIIGVTEAELGIDLNDRCNTIKRIRSIIDKINPNLPIHVLGAGNPISILFYSLLGANLFDGLTWCKNAINPKNGILYDFAQIDLFECDCDACKNKKLPYQRRVMLHNLIFYNKFCEEIYEAIANSKIKQLSNKYLPKEASDKLKKLVELHE